MLIIKAFPAHIGPNHLISSGPDLTRRILAARIRYSRGPWFEDRQRSSLKKTNHVLDLIIQEGVPEHQVDAEYVIAL